MPRTTGIAELLSDDHLKRLMAPEAAENYPSRSEWAMAIGTALANRGLDAQQVARVLVHPKMPVSHWAMFKNLGDGRFRKLTETSAWRRAISTASRAVEWVKQNPSPRGQLETSTEIDRRRRLGMRRIAELALRAPSDGDLGVTSATADTDHLVWQAACEIAAAARSFDFSASTRQIAEMICITHTHAAYSLRRLTHSGLLRRLKRGAGVLASEYRLCHPVLDGSLEDQIPVDVRLNIVLEVASSEAFAVSREAIDRLSHRHGLILGFMRANPDRLGGISVEEISACLGIAEHLVERRVLQMRERGLVVDDADGYTIAPQLPARLRRVATNRGTVGWLAALIRRHVSDRIAYRNQGRYLRAAFNRGYVVYMVDLINAQLAEENPENPVRLETSEDESGNLYAVDPVGGGWIPMEQLSDFLEMDYLVTRARYQRMVDVRGRFSWLGHQMNDLRGTRLASAG